MDGKQQQPKTLQEAIRFFGNPDNVLVYMIRLRWPDGVVTCPTCGRTDVVFLKNQRKWQCKSVHPKRQFSAKVGTVMEDSPIPADKWLTAVWLLSNCKNGISSYEVASALGITQKSAWFMMHRIRFGLSLNAKKFGTKTKIGGPENEVEVDETFVGGQKKNMHLDKKVRYEARGGAQGKTIVQGILDRTARQVRAKVMPNVKRETLQTEILRQVKYGTKVYTDDAVAYEQGMQWRFVHEFVNKTETYVRGRVHVNGMENFWSLLKRGLKGTYVAVERFALALPQFANKRLTYSELTGKDGATDF